MTITGQRGPAGASDHSSLLNIPLSSRSVAVPASNLADLVQTRPGLAYSGQGGRLQTVSIRGISGQRLANFYGDLPIISERRAGTSSSFIDPLMLETVEIVRGPASVYYGSGAVAGVLQFQPARPTSAEVQLQWGTQGSENLQYIGYGNGELAAAFSRRGANDTKAADNTPLHTSFEQLNAQFLWDFAVAGKQMSFFSLLSEAENTGKSNSLFPDERVTEYPRERHWIAQLRGELGKRVSGSAYYHQQVLETRVDQQDQNRNEVENSARDWGMRLEYMGISTQFPLHVGVEYLGRRNVQAQERELSSGETPPAALTTLDGDQDGVDLFLDGVHGFGPVELAGGLRWSFLSQQADGFASEKDAAPSLFLRGTWLANAALEVSLELASGVRFPSLSERFFSGTTGRGQVLGNAELDPEQTLGADLGLRRHSARSALDVHIYATQIDDYIERLDVAPDVRSFTNLGKGEIIGTEAAWKFMLNEAFTLRAGGHYLEGEDQSGTPLADIAAPRISLGFDYQLSDWRASVDYQHRFAESRVAPSERAHDRAGLLSASLTRTWRPDWRVSLWGRNLLDETYHVSSDALSPLGERRALGITLSWQGKPAKHKPYR